MCEAYTEAGHIGEFDNIALKEYKIYIVFHHVRTSSAFELKYHNY